MEQCLRAAQTLQTQSPCQGVSYSPDECVALVLENSDLLDVTERWEGFLHEFLSEAVGETPAVDRAVGGAWLVVHLIESEWLRVHCTDNKAWLLTAEQS